MAFEGIVATGGRRTARAGTASWLGTTGWMAEGLLVGGAAAYLALRYPLLVGLLQGIRLLLLLGPLAGRFVRTLDRWGVLGVLAAPLFPQTDRTAVHELAHDLRPGAVVRRTRPKTGAEQRGFLRRTLRPSQDRDHQAECEQPW